ncbi:DPP IV N-terminal domain-containing protein [Niabella sp. W65]|nr:DPP IV N-terminal domain-containing protein [Niabella sp. W65]MCH7368097.1 DPP IV N-terminal domain-containing protein [Niabella sp. W65]
MFAKLSPDNTKVAYVSEYNLYVEDLASGAITALTKGGNRKISTEHSTGRMKRSFSAGMDFVGRRIVKRLLTGTLLPAIPKCIIW